MAAGGRHRAAGAAASVLLIVGLVLVVVGAVAWWAQPFGERSAARSPVTSSTPAPDPASGPQQVVRRERVPKEVRAAWEPGAPQRLEVPALGIDAPIVPIDAPGGVLTPPSDPQVLGWWADGARPGARRGSALVTGHTVHDGGGAMDDLERLGRGDRVWMLTDRGRIGYEVRSVVVLGKGQLAARAASVFDQGTAGRLVLITCEDWNGVEYLSNVVVTARPVA